MARKDSADGGSCYGDLCRGGEHGRPKLSAAYEKNVGKPRTTLCRLRGTAVIPSMGQLLNGEAQAANRPLSVCPTAAARTRTNHLRPPLGLEIEPASFSDCSSSFALYKEERAQLRVALFGETASAFTSRRGYARCNYVSAHRRKFLSRPEKEKALSMAYKKIIRRD